MNLDLLFVEIQTYLNFARAHMKTCENCQKLGKLTIFHDAGIRGKMRLFLGT